MSEKKKRGRGNPTPPFIGPKREKWRDLHNPAKPKCGTKYRDRYGIWKVCGKRGLHLNHGPGKG